MFCKESDDDVNDFMKGFGHILKLWVLLSALSSETFPESIDGV